MNTSQAILEATTILNATARGYRDYRPSSIYPVTCQLIASSIIPFHANPLAPLPQCTSSNPKPIGVIASFCQHPHITIHAICLYIMSTSHEQGLSPEPYMKMPSGTACKCVCWIYNMWVWATQRWPWGSVERNGFPCSAKGI